MLQENKQPSEAPGSPASTSNDADEMIDGTQYPSLQNYSVLHGLVGPACIFLRQSIAITQIVRTAVLLTFCLYSTSYYSYFSSPPHTYTSLFILVV